MMIRKKRHSEAVHARAIQLHAAAQRAGTLKRPGGLIAGFIGGRFTGRSLDTTSYRQYVPEARNELAAEREARVARKSKPRRG